MINFSWIFFQNFSFFFKVWILKHFFTLWKIINYVHGWFSWCVKNDKSKNLASDFKWRLSFSWPVRIQLLFYGYFFERNSIFQCFAPFSRKLCPNRVPANGNFVSGRRFFRSRLGCFLLLVAKFFGAIWWLVFWQNGGTDWPSSSDLIKPWCEASFNFGLFVFWLLAIRRLEKFSQLMQKLLAGGTRVGRWLARSLLVQWSSDY